MTALFNQSEATFERLYEVDPPRVTGAIFGAVIADCIGSKFQHAEFPEPKIIETDLRYTNFSRFLFAVIGALLRNPALHEADLVGKLLVSFEPTRYATDEIHLMKSRLPHWHRGGESKRSDVWKLDGESYLPATRAVPIGLLLAAARDERLREVAVMNASATHTDPITLELSALVAKATAIVARLKRDEFDGDAFLSTLCEFTIRADLRARLGQLRPLLIEEDLRSISDFSVLARKIVPKLGNGSACASDAVITALFMIACFARHSTYLDMLRRIIALGGEVDAMACICGGIMGSLIGYDALPPSLLGLLQRGEAGAAEPGTDSEWNHMWITNDKFVMLVCGEKVPVSRKMDLEGMLHRPINT